MGEERPLHRQMRFENGRLVPPDDEAAEPGDEEEIEPGVQTGVAVAIDAGALAVNDALAAARENYGEVLEFGSLAEATAYARRLSVQDGQLSVRQADRDDVDACLTATHERSTDGSATVDPDTWTFEVGPDLQTALREAVVTAGSSPAALEHFVRADLDLQTDDELTHGLRVQTAGSGVVSFGDRETGDLRSWAPDCKVEARDGWNGDLLEEYWCEVVLEDAAVDADQLATMREFARTARVLTVRVWLDDLPDSYAVRIDEIAAGPRADEAAAGE